MNKSKHAPMNIAVLGIGNMGKALIGGLKNVYADNIRIAAWDKIPEALDKLNGAESISPYEWKSSEFTPDAVILSVKPADIPAVLNVVASVSREQGLNLLTISIAAGVSIASIRANLENDAAKVCRVMPNTPALIGEGMSAYALSDNCSLDDAKFVERIFSACGKVMSIPENLMNAVTGLSGSGPAFVYSFIEALAEGGVSAGLSYPIALEFATQTVIGAARMVRSTSEHPSVLRSKVMSPGGATVKGLEALERGAFKSAVMAAVTEAAAQSAKMFL